MRLLKAVREEYLEKKANIDELVEVLRSENRKVFHEEEKTNYEKLYKEAIELKEEMETIERCDQAKALATPEYDEVVERVNNGVNRKKVSDEEYDHAANAWFYTRIGRPDKINYEMKRSVERTGLSLHNTNIIVRAQTIGTGSQGGNLLNGSIMQGVVKQLKDFGGIRALATVKTSPTGEPQHWTPMDDTANEASIIGENQPVSNTAVVYGDKISIGSFTYRTLVKDISWEAMQDLDFASEVGPILGERLARKQNKNWVYGTGTTHPFGLLTECLTGKTAALTTVFTVDELQDLKHSIDPAYRTPECKWVMNDQTYLKISKMVDNNNRPLLLTDYREGSFGYLLGSPVVINQDYPDATAGNACISFGRHDSYVIRDVAEMRIQFLDQLYAENGSVGFVGFSRADGRLRNPKAVKKLVMKA